MSAITLLFDHLLTDDFSVPPGGAGGLSATALKGVIGYYVSAFPDLHYTIKELIAEDDAVAARLEMSGTHKVTTRVTQRRARRSRSMS